MANALCMLSIKFYKYTLRMRNNHCFSTAKLVARTRLNVTLYVHCLSCNCSAVCNAFHRETELVISRKCICMRLKAAVTLPVSWESSWYVVYLQRTECILYLNTHTMSQWLNSCHTVDKNINSSWFCIFLLPSDNYLHKICEQITNTSLFIVLFLVVYTFIFGRVTSFEVATRPLFM